MRTLADIESDTDAVIAASATMEPADAAKRLVSLAEETLEQWVCARGQEPTHAAKEGFRLLALQRQGARGEPSFNACRETCRELAYHYNLIMAEPGHREAAARVRMAGLVARHLVYFVAGKLQVEGLGEFCCAAKPMRAADEATR